jgi:hypothetical protein
MIALLSVLFVFPFQTKVSGWDIFLKTRYEVQYMEDKEMYADIPIFDEKIKSLEGSEITLAGYYLPIEIDDNRIIISKLPYASCFFCGGNVGLESVAEVQFENEPPRFDLDEILTIKGRLKLNEREFGHLVFILTDARVMYP